MAYLRFKSTLMKQKMNSLICIYTSFITKSFSLEESTAAIYVAFGTKYAIMDLS